MPFPCYIVIDTDCPNCQKLMQWKYFQQWLEYIRKAYHVQIIDKRTAMALGLGEWTCDEWGRLTYRIKTPILWCMGNVIELVDDNCFKHDPKYGKVIDPAVARIRLYHARTIIARCFSEYMKMLGGGRMRSEEEYEDEEEETGGRRGRGGGGGRSGRRFEPGSAP